MMNSLNKDGTMKELLKLVLFAFLIAFGIAYVAMGIAWPIWIWFV